MSGKISNFLAFFVVFLLSLEIAINPLVTASMSQQSIYSRFASPISLYENSETQLSVQLLDEEIKLCVINNKSFPEIGVINRLVSINGTQIMVSGYILNINRTWPDTYNKTRSFDAIWVRGVSQQSILPVDKEKYYYNNPLVFASNYNGTHFSEAIISGNASIGTLCGKLFWKENDSFLFDTWPEIIVSENNRTEIYGNNSESLYNPSLAILTAHRYLEERNYTYDNVTDVFLIPRPYLLDTYKKYEFIWHLVFIKDLTEPGAKNATIMFYQFILSPDCKVISARIERLVEGYISTCYSCNDDSLYKWLFTYGPYLVISIVVGVVTVVFWVLRRKRRLIN